MIIMNMSEMSLPYIHLTSFGAIVLDIAKIDNYELLVIHVSTKKPIDLLDPRTKEQIDLFFKIVEILIEKLKILYRGAIISGRMPIPLVMYIKACCINKLSTWSSDTYVYDPKLKRAFNQYLDSIEIKEWLANKLNTEYDELVDRVLQSQSQ